MKGVAKEGLRDRGRKNRKVMRVAAEILRLWRRRNRAMGDGEDDTERDTVEVIGFTRTSQRVIKENSDHGIPRDGLIVYEITHYNKKPGFAGFC